MRRLVQGFKGSKFLCIDDVQGLFSLSDLRLGIFENLLSFFLADFDLSALLIQFLFFLDCLGLILFHIGACNLDFFQDGLDLNLFSIDFFLFYFQVLSQN